jgi:UMF1 family MFS transporter
MTTSKQPADKRAVFSWALYDWANSAFATTVMAGFFPLFFKQFWSSGTEATVSTFYLGMGNSIASLLVVLMAPVLGALADRGGLRKRMLATFASLGCVMTGALFLVAQGQWPLAILLYATAVLGFAGANVFYDALLVVVSPAESRHRVSALGYALGYLGGGLLFLINVLMTLKPDWFGLGSSAEGVRWSFLTVALWWAAFSLPLLLNVSEPQATHDASELSIRAAFAGVIGTIRRAQAHPAIWWFLLAYWFYFDGVATIIRMAVDYGLSIGLDSGNLITALLIVQFVGFPAALLAGRIGQRYGAHRGIWIALWAYVGLTVFAATLSTTTQIYLFAALIGLFQGGIQALSRSLFSQMIPAAQAAEFFGLYNTVGKAAAVFGPVMVGVTARLSGDSRLGMLSIVLLFLLGMVMFLKVPRSATGAP